MAYLKLYKEKLKHNYHFLKKLFDDNGIEAGFVTKLLCGNKEFIHEVLDLGVKEVHDSRISNLKTIKKMDPSIQTVYIKPPPKKIISSVIRYADVSLNTEFSTIRMLSDEAVRQDKKHKVLIMIETGDLREGVMGDHLIDFYEKIFRLPNIEVVGIGSNLNCLHGVMPSQDKLVQLSLYKQLIEARFNTKIPYVSGGTSVTIPLLLKKMLPKGINHFRIGETLFFGVDLFEDKTIPGMRDDVFEFYAQIIELTEKPMVPIGELAANPSGEIVTVDPALYGRTSYRAILDVGLLDIHPDFLIPKRKNVKIVGASSDMLVVDLGRNSARLKVGDMLQFELKYMGALSLLNSYYITKIIE